MTAMTSLDKEEEFHNQNKFKTFAWMLKAYWAQSLKESPMQDEP